MSMAAYPTYQGSMDVDLVVNPTRLTITHRGPSGEDDVVLAFVWQTGEVSFQLTEAQRCQLIAHLERNGPSGIWSEEDPS